MIGRIRAHTNNGHDERYRRDGPLLRCLRFGRGPAADESVSRCRRPQPIMRELDDERLPFLTSRRRREFGRSPPPAHNDRGQMRQTTSGPIHLTTAHESAAVAMRGPRGPTEHSSRLFTINNMQIAEQLKEISSSAALVVGSVAAELHE
jgi:hypothetical protein